MADDSPRILVTLPTGLQETFFTPALRSRLAEIGPVEWNETDEQFSQSELADWMAQTRIVLTGWGSPQLDENVVAATDQLGLLAHTAGSVAHYVSAALYDVGARVVSANRPMARFVAEATLGHMIGAEREIVHAHEAIRDGQYGVDGGTRSVTEATIGLVGLGTIGRYLLPMLAPFDVDVQVYDPYVPPVDLTEYPSVTKATLEDTLSDADIVSIHAARTPETRGLLGAEELALIPDGALLVNTARAHILDEDAMRSTLQSGRIRAALDVYHEEPLPDDDPLRELSNVQLSPHLGGQGPRERFTAAVIEDIERFVAGRALQHEIPKEQADLMTR